MENQAAVGIYGGTFDPVHLGHMKCAQAAADAFDFEQVFFIPTKNPNFKQDKSVTCANTRLDMLELALDDFGDERFFIDTRELRREGITYSIDTLKELSDEHPGVRHYFIMGTDSAETLWHWRSAQEISKLCSIVVIARKGYDFNKLKEIMGNQPVEFDMHYLQTEIPDISSSEVREFAKNGQNLSRLVCPSVENYIKEHGLYKK